MKLARQRTRGRTALAGALATGAAGVLLAFGSACSASEPSATPAGGEGEIPAPRTARASLGCTRYAAPWGRDSSGGSARRPFRTAQRLADSLRPGQTGCLRGGRYDGGSEEYVLDVERGGRRGARVVIRSFPGERATLVGTVAIERRAPFVTLAGLGIEGTGDGNTVKIYSSGAVITGATITNRGRGESCMILGSTSGYGEAIGTVVRGSRFDRCGSRANDNKDHAIYVSNAIGARIVGNVFSRTAGYSIHFYPHARRAYVAENVIDGGPPSVRGGVLFGGNDEYVSSGNLVERNVIAYAQSSNITSGWDDAVGTGNVARRNCIWGAREGNVDDSDGGFVARENVVAPPLFVNRARGDYRLTHGSRCRRVVGFRLAPRAAGRG